MAEVFLDFVTAPQSRRGLEYELYKAFKAWNPVFNGPRSMYVTLRLTVKGAQIVFVLLETLSLRTKVLARAIAPDGSEAILLSVWERHAV